MLAGYLNLIPIRINNFTGQQWVIKRGIIRMLIKNIDRLVGKLSTLNLVDSNGQLKFLINKKIINEKKSKVLLKGSISGFDPFRFKPNSINRAKIREDLNISIDAKVFLYVGRINVNKGLSIMAKALIKIIETYPNIIFLIVGPDEDNFSSQINFLFLNKPDNLRILPFADNPEHYMQASDIFCLLSNKEGFGSAVIEAAACGLPTIGSDIYGLQDSIDRDKTGYLIDRNNHKKLISIIQEIINNPEKLSQLSNAAINYANENFHQDKVTNKLVKQIDELVKKKKL